MAPIHKIIVDSDTAGDDAAEARWIEIVNGAPRLPEGERLAFDHAQIIADAAALLL